MLQSRKHPSHPVAVAEEVVGLDVHVRLLRVDVSKSGHGQGVERQHRVKRELILAEHKSGERRMRTAVLYMKCDNGLQQKIK